MSKRKNRPRLELKIDSIGFEGVAIARVEGKVYFVKGAVPGDKVIVEVKRNKKNYAECHLIEVIEKSDLRIEPPCSHFGVCGGCTWQNLPYSEQTAWKTKHVEDAIKRIGKLESTEVKPILESETIFNYRNKMDFSFSSGRWLTQAEVESEEEIENRNFALGLHIPGRYDKVLDLKHCFIQSDFGNEIMPILKEEAIRLGLTAYNSREQSGFLRGLIIRNSVKTNETMVILVTNDVTSKDERHYIEYFKKVAIELNATSVYHAINNTVNPVKVVEQFLLEGKENLTDEILGIKYEISPFSFFQTNSYQLDIFIAKIIEVTNPQPNDTIWDLYCGTGSITLPIAGSCKKVIGIELNSDSIDNAIMNSKLNNISNTEFYASNLHDKNIPELLTGLERPDKIILDPPRAGIAENLINHLLEIESKEITYVSCNPSTQARDLQLLSNKYIVEYVIPVDMFPHTYHIESIAKLVLRNDGN
jgi:23S rRNA (uracil1939-C5)-methyltransferase